MKKLILFIFIFLVYLTPSFAALSDTSVSSGYNAATIVDTNVTHPRCRGVWIGTTQSLDFSFDGSTWVTFQGATAGTVIPLQVVGARITAGSASPNSGDIVFLY